MATKLNTADDARATLSMLSRYILIAALAGYGSILVFVISHTWGDDLDDLLSPQPLSAFLLLACSAAYYFGFEILKYYKLVYLPAAAGAPARSVPDGELAAIYRNGRWVFLASLVIGIFGLIMLVFALLYLLGEALKGISYY